MWYQSITGRNFLTIYWIKVNLRSNLITVWLLPSLLHLDKDGDSTVTDLCNKKRSHKLCQIKATCTIAHHLWQLNSHSDYSLQGQLLAIGNHPSMDNLPVWTTSRHRWLLGMDNLPAWTTNRYGQLTVLDNFPEFWIILWTIPSKQTNIHNNRNSTGLDWISLKQLPTLVRRTHYSQLSNSELKKHAHLTIKVWKTIML